MQIFRPQTVKDALNAVAVAQAGDVVHMPVAPMGHFKPGRIAAGVILQAGTYSRIECSSDGVIFDRPVVKSMGQGFDTFGIIITGNDCVIKYPTIDNRDGTVWTVRDWLNKACGGIMLRGHRNKVTGGTLYNVRHGVVPHDQGSASIIEGVHIDGIAGDAFRLNQDDMVLSLCRAVNFKAVDGNHDDGGQGFAIDPATGKPAKGASTAAVRNVTVSGNTFLATTDPRDEIITRVKEPGPLVMNQPPLSSAFQGIVMFNGVADGWVVDQNTIASTPWKHGISLTSGQNCTVTNNVVIDINPVFRGDQMQIAVQRNNGNVVSGNQAARINPFWPGNQEIAPADYGKHYRDPANFDYSPIGSVPAPVPAPAPVPVPPAPVPPPVEEPETPAEDPQEPLPPTDDPQAAIIAEIESGLANLTALVAKLKG